MSYLDLHHKHVSYYQQCHQLNSRLPNPIPSARAPKLLPADCRWFFSSVVFGQSLATAWAANCAQHSSLHAAHRHYPAQTHSRKRIQPRHPLAGLATKPAPGHVHYHTCANARSHVHVHNCTHTVARAQPHVHKCTCTIARAQPHVHNPTAPSHSVTRELCR